MFRLCLGLCAVVLLAGCSTKEEQELLRSYASKTSYHKHLQQTEKAEFSENNISVAMLTATYQYIPNFEKNDTRDEVFVVGVLFDNPDVSKMVFDKNSSFDADTNRTLTGDNEYLLTLDNNHAIKVLHLGKHDKRLKGISFVSEWGDYYEVTYPHSEEKQFNLVFENSKYGKETLPFAKVAKYIYTKKGI